jgi:hypothetical protein
MRAVVAPRAANARLPSRIRALDVIALEILLQSIELRGTIQDPQFRREAERIRRKKSGHAKKFGSLFGLLEEIDARGLLRCAELRRNWERIRKSRGAPARNRGIRPPELTRT